MKKYAGILLIVLGAIILVLSYFLDWVDYNPVQASAFGLMVIGFILHIVLMKKAPKEV